MSRWPLLVVVASLVGCAAAVRPDSGDSPDADDTIGGGRVDGRTPDPDAPRHPIDAPESIDASPIDAEPHHDAPPVQPDAPPACTAVVMEKLVNGNFDTVPAPAGWVETPIQGLSGGPYPIITQDPTGLAKQSGAWNAWLGGAAGEDAGTTTVTDSIAQAFAVGADATNLVVTGYYLVGTTETANIGAYDTFSLDVINAQGAVLQHLLSLDNDDALGTATWTAFSFPVTAAAVAGQTVRLRATSSNDIYYNSNFFLDTLSFKATQCP